MCTHVFAGSSSGQHCSEFFGQVKFGECFYRVTMRQVPHIQQGHRAVGSSENPGVPVVMQLTYSHLSNNRGGWNKCGGSAKVAKSINVEGGIF